MTGGGDKENCVRGRRLLEKMFEGGSETLAWKMPGGYDKDKSSKILLLTTPKR